MRCSKGYWSVSPGRRCTTVRQFNGPPQLAFPPRIRSHLRCRRFEGGLLWFAKAPLPGAGSIRHQKHTLVGTTVFSGPGSKGDPPCFSEWTLAQVMAYLKGKCATPTWSPQYFQCSELRCARRGRQNGLCVLHRGRSVCTHANCGIVARASGRCIRHGLDSFNA